MRFYILPVPPGTLLSKILDPPLVHHVEALLEDNPKLSVLCSDVKNAFNSVSRDHLFFQGKHVFPEIYHHAEQMYGKPSTLIYVKGQEVVKLQSQEGDHQGDPLGPTLFALTLHPILTEIQGNHKDTTILACQMMSMKWGHNLSCCCLMTSKLLSGILVWM